MARDVPESDDDTGQVLRDAALGYARAADMMDEVVTGLRQAIATDDAAKLDAVALVPGVPAGASPSEILDMATTLAYQARTAQSAVAETVRAHEEYIAAGGHENPDAVRDYMAVFERTSGLMPEWGRSLGT